MRRSLAMLLLMMMAPSARADRVHLDSGNVIEGKATQRGETVVVEVESGAISLPRASVTKIEKSESAVQRYEARHAQLKPGDVKGLLELADFCRDHGMNGRERELLQQLLEHAPDHAQARARLGYVRSDGGWITHEQHMRARGMVQRGGRWLTPEQLAEAERLEAQRAEAAREREQAQLELERQKLALEQARLEAEASKARVVAAEAERDAANARAASSAQTTPVYTVWAPIPRELLCAKGYEPVGPHGRCRRAAEPAPRPPRSHTAVGYSDPWHFIRSGR